MTFTAMKAAGAAAAALALGAGVALASGAAAQEPAPAKAELTKNKNYLSAVMSGAWEIGKDGSPVEGSAARGSAQIHVVGESTICYGLTVNGLGEDDAPVAAHIHRGKINENGPIVIELEAPEEGNPGWGGGCTEVDPAVLKRVQRAPVKYYVNIHSNEFKDGALRGQLAWTRWFQPAR
jgi:CHRD domain